VVSRCGDTYVALVTAGGWEVAPAPRRFPGYFGGDGESKATAPRGRADWTAAARRGRAFGRGDAWVAVPRRQPARIALDVGRAAEDGDFARFRERLAAARLEEVAGELRYLPAAGPPLTFRPGASATAGGRPIAAAAYPPLDGPFLSRAAGGGWRFAWKAARLALPEAG
jgi:hypothetical protein